MVAEEREAGALAETIEAVEALERGAIVDDEGLGRLGADRCEVVEAREVVDSDPADLGVAAVGRVEGRIVDLGPAELDDALEADEAGQERAVLNLENGRVGVGETAQRAEAVERVVPVEGQRADDRL